MKIINKLGFPIISFLVLAIIFLGYQITNAAPSPTDNVDFALTTPAENGGSNHLTGGGGISYVNVDVANGTTSVVITGTKLSSQTITVTGFFAAPRDDSLNVVVTGTDTEPIYTVNTVTNGLTSPNGPGDNVSIGGGNKTFRVTISEGGKTSINYTINVQVASAPYTPTATPTEGTYTSAQDVALESFNSTSIMYSTTDDYDPSLDDCFTAPKYTDPISVTSSLTIRAVGCDDDGNKSPMGTFIYTINKPKSNHTSSGSYPFGYVSSETAPTVTTSATLTTSPTIPTTLTFTFLNNLKSGMDHPDVKELQKFLNSHSFPISLTEAGSSGNETNKFGSLTKMAVIKFQLANNLAGDGIVGPLTRAVLNK